MKNTLTFFNYDRVQNGKRSSFSIALKFKNQREKRFVSALFTVFCVVLTLKFLLS